MRFMQLCSPEAGGRARNRALKKQFPISLAVSAQRWSHFWNLSSSRGLLQTFPFSSAPWLPFCALQLLLVFSECESKTKPKTKLTTTSNRLCGPYLLKTRIFALYAQPLQPQTRVQFWASLLINPLALILNFGLTKHNCFVYNACCAPRRINPIQHHVMTWLILHALIHGWLPTGC